VGRGSTGGRLHGVKPIDVRDLERAHLSFLHRGVVGASAAQRWRDQRATYRRSNAKGERHGAMAGN